MYQQYIYHSSFHIWLCSKIVKWFISAKILQRFSSILARTSFIHHYLNHSLWGSYSVLFVGSCPNSARSSEALLGFNKQPRILNFLQCVGQTIVLAKMSWVAWLRHTAKRNVGMQGVRWGSVWEVKDFILWTTQNWYHICWPHISNNCYFKLLYNIHEVISYSLLKLPILLNIQTASTLMYLEMFQRATCF